MTEQYESPLLPPYPDGEQGPFVLHKISGVFEWRKAEGANLAMIQRISKSNSIQKAITESRNVNLQLMCKVSCGEFAGVADDQPDTPHVVEAKEPT